MGITGFQGVSIASVMEQVESIIAAASRETQVNLEQSISILELQQNASLGADVPTNTEADWFNDANGFRNTIDTGSTTATFSTDHYECSVEGGGGDLTDDMSGDINTNWDVANSCKSSGTWSFTGGQLVGAQDTNYKALIINKVASTNSVYDVKIQFVDNTNDANNDYEIGLGDEIPSCTQGGEDVVNNGYYVRRLSASSAQFYKVTNGSAATLGSSFTVDWSKGRYVRLELTATHVKFYDSADGENWTERKSEADATYRTSLKIVLGNAGGLGSTWDNLTAAGWGGGSNYTNSLIVSNALVSSNATNITHTHLVIDGSIPTGTSVKYDVSSDNGSTWTENLDLNTKNEITSTQGKNLKLKIKLNTNAGQDETPTINGYSLAYWD